MQVFKNEKENVTNRNGVSGRKWKWKVGGGRQQEVEQLARRTESVATERACTNLTTAVNLDFVVNFSVQWFEPFLGGVFDGLSGASNRSA